MKSSPGWTKNSSNVWVNLSFIIYGFTRWVLLLYSSLTGVYFLGYMWGKKKPHIMIKKRPGKLNPIMNLVLITQKSFVSLACVLGYEKVVEFDYWLKGSDY